MGKEEFLEEKDRKERKGIAAAIPKKTHEQALSKIVPKPAREPKVRVEVSARSLTREGGTAGEAAISLSGSSSKWRIDIGGGGAKFFAYEGAAPYGRIYGAYQTENRHLNFYYRGGAAYTGISETGNVFTAHQFGSSLRFDIKKAELRIAAALTPAASYNPIYIEAQWAAGVSLKLRGFMPYAAVGGELATETAVHTGLPSYFVPRLRAYVGGLAWKPSEGLAFSGEAKYTPFYAEGMARGRYSLGRYAFDLSIGGRKWESELFGGRGEFLAGGSVTVRFGAKEGRVSGRIKAEAEGYSRGVSENPRNAGGFSKANLFSDIEKNDAEMKKYVLFRDSIPMTASLEGLAGYGIGASVKTRIFMASMLAERMEAYTYDYGHDLAGRPRGVSGKEAGDFYADLRRAYEIEAEDAKKGVFGKAQYPSTSCSEIHHSVARMLRLMGLRAFTVSAASKGWNWHVLASAIGDDGTYLIDYGDVYRSGKYDLSMLLRGYAAKSGLLLLGSYIFTDAAYIGRYESPEKKLLHGVVGVEHWEDFVRAGLGVDRGAAWPW